MRRRTFERITSTLRDGGWHEIEDLRTATSFPEGWVRELRAEGILDSREERGRMKVRLVSAPPLAPHPHDGAGVFDLSP